MRRSLVPLRVIALVGLGSLLVQACDKVPFVAPSGTAITLLATQTILPLNGSVEITAVLLEGALAGGTGGNVTSGAGTPVHNGTIVYFSTTLGRLEPAEAQTTGGRATVRLISDGRSGTAKVTATSGPASQTLDLTIGAAAAARVVVTAEPQALPSSGGTTTIRARVEDQNGNGLPGLTVSFSTTAGSLSSTSAVSNDTGVASTTLATPGPATVTASAPGGTSGLTGTVGVTTATRMTLSVTPPSTAAVSVPAAFTVIVGSTAGTQGVLDDVVVRLDGDQVSLGTVSQGVAATFSYLFGSSGVRSVSASGRDPQGAAVTATTQVAVSPLTANGTPSPQTVAFGGSVLFTVTTSPAGAAIEKYIWDFGEGGGQQETSSNQRNYVFQQRGTKTVTVIVVPTKGPRITVLMQVDVF